MIMAPLLNSDWIMFLFCMFFLLGLVGTSHVYVVLPTGTAFKIGIVQHRLS